jgi:predicted DNA-binding antitoxin AbrB/MazE fold protein
MPFVKAEFDGRVFVPCEPVDLPTGTRVEVVVPPAQMTADERRQWEEIAAQIESSAPHFTTVEDALRYSRKRP